MDEQNEVVDVELTPTDVKKRPTPALVALGGAALFAVLLLGAYLATSDDDSPVDVAAAEDVVGEVDDEVASPTTTAGPDGDDDVDMDLPAEAVATTIGPRDAFASEEAADSAFYGGGPSDVIFDGTQFVAIGWNESGSTLRTSVDGVTWDEISFPGLPQDSNVYHLAEHDGTLVAIVEQWSEPEMSDDPIEQYFGSYEAPTHYLASSTDLESWTVTELPTGGQSDEPVYTGVVGVALSDYGVVVLTQQHNEGTNEMRTLFDAGILNEDNIDRFCGMDFDGLDVDSETNPVFSVQLCNFEDEEAFWVEFEEAMAAATTDEERAEVERRFEGEAPEEIEPEVIATIAPGDPIYDEINSAYFGSGQDAVLTSISGPATGPFVSTTMTQTGYPTGLVEVDGTVVAILQNWDERVDGGPINTVISTTDGVSWSEVGALPTEYVERLSVAGSNLVAVVSDGSETATAYVSTDLGGTWTATSITSELYGAYAQTAGGPAGVATIVRGSTEPYPEFAPPSEISVTRDGYTLTMFYSEDGSKNTLLGPDGNEVYSFTDEEMYGEGDIEGLVRTSRLTGMPTFLDPETGEELVTFTTADFDAAYGVEDEVLEDEVYEQGSEFWFSVDGVTWSPITDPQLVEAQGSSVELVAVGDDEVIFTKYTWTEPPADLFAFEEEARDPSEAEIAALDSFYASSEDGIEYIRVEVG